MLAQLKDLTRRLALCGTPAERLLDAEERQSDWLLKKAFKRVWHDGPNRKTRAMMDTPRRLLAQRALRGGWAAFPVSPAQFEGPLQSHTGASGYIDYRLVGLVARGLEFEVELQALPLRSAAERLALYRAALTAVIEVMDHADDSLAELADAFREFERRYLELLSELLDLDGVLEDLLELCVWEDYGLFNSVESFLGALSGEHAQRAQRALAGLIQELQAEGLDYQVRKALELRAALAP